MFMAIFGLFQGDPWHLSTQNWLKNATNAMTFQFRKSCNVLIKPMILPKNNEQIRFFAKQYYDRIVLFVFWKNLRIAKSPFETDCPLLNSIV